ncbi:sulfurtransferase [Nodosilinea sp. PGN35]|uniref:sulfurtransferase n=1 Tax=Nodosilinea sp. PGN35 TaxID=3020489 RepID=UPI0023B26B71|nr:sulfurtransferase [Nodosilinea sp. TSF1-S3]MDF0368734.1 sulfurtransferase [Nodosilinea sp. TSF1-S3]
MNRYARPDVLVDTQWLEDRLDEPDLRILEVDMSPAPYEKAHIPGAVFLNPLTDLLRPDLRLKTEPDAIDHLLSQAGIGPETTVVAYGGDPGTGAWIFWLLQAVGHRRVKVLNGGYQRWIAEGRPLAHGLATVVPTQYSARPFDASSRVSLQEVEAAVASPSQILLDVRSLPEYQGRIFLMQPPKPTERAGHIPGAVHLEHTLTLNGDGTFKPVEELQALFQQRGITADRDIFPYCAIGARSAFMWFVLTYLLGYPNVRNYDGSWNEWSRLLHTPVET